MGMNWISAKDRLPINKTNVLMYLTRYSPAWSNKIVDVGYLSNNIIYDTHEFEIGVCHPSSSAKGTDLILRYWMPLPELPE